MLGTGFLSALTSTLLHHPALPSFDGCYVVRALLSGFTSLPPTVLASFERN